MKILVADKLAPAALELLRPNRTANSIISDPKNFHEHLADGRRPARSQRRQGAAGCDRKGAAPQGHRPRRHRRRQHRSRGRHRGRHPGDEHARRQRRRGRRAHARADAVDGPWHPAGQRLDTRSGKWEKKQFLGTELRGKTLGVIGLGSIGREVVQRARAFEMRVVAHRSLRQQGLGRGHRHRARPVSTSCSPSATTSHSTSRSHRRPRTCISTDQFARMKDGVRIVNCARGGIIDEAALFEAIRLGKVAGAGLDVFAIGAAGGQSAARARRAVSPRRTSAAPPVRPRRSSASASPSSWSSFSVQRRRHQRRQHAVRLPGAVPAGRPLHRPRRAPGRLRRADFASGNPKTVRLIYYGDIGTRNTQPHPQRRTGRCPQSSSCRRR